jgi:hypothetical protein
VVGGTGRDPAVAGGSERVTGRRERGERLLEWQTSFRSSPGSNLLT